MGCSEQNRRRPHLLMVCVPAESHFFPFRQILYHLSSPRYMNEVIVTLIGGKQKIEEIAELKARGNFGTLELRLAENVMPNMVGKVVHKEKPGPELFARMCEESFEPHKQRLLQEKDSADAPTCILADMLYIFLQDLAQELQIPLYPLVSAPSFYIYTLLIGSNPLLQSADPEVRKQAIPGLAFGRIFDIPPERQWYTEFYDKFCYRYERCKGMLINIVEEWDAPAGSLAALRSHLELNAKNVVNGSEQIPRVVPIGPMNSVDGFALTPSSPIEQADGLSQKSECLTWLDKQPAKSVLYVAFGTMVNITPQAMLELAHGLQDSGVSFLWVVKIPKSDSLASYLPPGFEEKVRGRGFFEMEYAPQSRILQHHSLAGFLSHCGWNSCMESICAGVPLITWPLVMDQPLNARFIVDVCKAGIGIKDVDELYFSDVGREEVTRAIKALLIRGEELRENALAHKVLAQAAIKEGGSSHASIHSFIQEIIPRQDTP